MKLLLVSLGLLTLSFSSVNDSKVEPNEPNVEAIPCDENSRPFFTTCSSGCLTVEVISYPGPNSYYRTPTDNEFNAWRTAEQASCGMPSLSMMP